MQHAMYRHESRVAFRGQVFSAPMDWNNMLQQLDAMEKETTHISLPLTGEVLAARVQLSISAGLVDLNKIIKEATVRRNVVVQLIRMHKDSGHPDYQRLCMQTVHAKAAELADTDEASIPKGLAEFFNNDDEDADLQLGGG